MCIKGMFVWEDFREEEKLRREQWKESIFSRCLVGREGGSRSKYSCASARLCHLPDQLFIFIFIFVPFPLIFVSSSIVLSVCVCFFFFLGYQKKKKIFYLFVLRFFPLLFSPSSSLFYFSFLVLLFIYLFIFVAHFPSCAPLKKIILKCSYNF